MFVRKRLCRRGVRAASGAARVQPTPGKDQPGIQDDRRSQCQQACRE
jgi:hypothetical protein